jgi:pheromone shutdown protein TraB
MELPSQCATNDVENILVIPNEEFQVSRRGVFGITAAALAIRPSPSFAAPFVCDDAVTVLNRRDADVYIVGTAHVSDLSAKLVANTIDSVEPTLLMVELDGKRVKGFGGEAPPGEKAAVASKPNIGTRLGAFLIGSVLKSMYASLEKLGLDTGEEFSVALSRAKKLNIPVLLADRDVDQTLRRLSEAAQVTSQEDLEKFEKALGSTELSGALQISMEGKDKQSVEASVELIKKRETVRTLVATFKETVPTLYDALVGERDEYMTNKLLERLGQSKEKQTVVAIVGMAHEDGITRNLTARGFVQPRRPRVCQERT